MSVAVVIGGIVIGAIVIGLAIYYGMKATKSSSPTTSGNSAAVTSALLNPVSATSTASTVTATPLAAPATTATPVVTASPGSSGTASSSAVGVPSVTVYSGANGGGTSYVMTNASQASTIPFQSPILSASVANGGSLSFSIGYANGTTTSLWNMPAGQTGVMNAPAAFSGFAANPAAGSSPLTSVTATINGVANTQMVPQSASSTPATFSTPTPTYAVGVVLTPTTGTPVTVMGGSYPLSGTATWASLSVGAGYNATMTGSNTIKITGPPAAGTYPPTTFSFTAANNTGYSFLTVSSQ